MNKEDIIRMAQETGVTAERVRDLINFANLVIANHPPQSFMSWQEGYEAGKQTEREACAKICDEFCYGSTKILVERAIRARGQA
jgi:hypothetical protein